MHQKANTAETMTTQYLRFVSKAKDAKNKAILTFINIEGNQTIACDVSA
ncbi:MAG: hypothetical protein U0K53_05815 [Paludibacteraceae bacterium]|nr:hypothetical protein [Paludibacteraceae bacterium]